MLTGIHRVVKLHWIQIVTVGKGVVYLRHKGYSGSFISLFDHCLIGLSVSTFAAKSEQTTFRNNAHLLFQLLRHTDLLGVYVGMYGRRYI